MPVQRLDESAPPAVALMTRRQYREYLAEQERAQLERTFAQPSAGEPASPREAPASGPVVDTAQSSVPSTIRLSIDVPPSPIPPAQPEAQTSSTEQPSTAPLLDPTLATQLLATPLPSRRELREQRAREEALRVAAERRARSERRATWSGHLPRVGIVGALGLATVVAPMVHSSPDAALDTASNALDIGDKATSSGAPVGSPAAAGAPVAGAAAAAGAAGEAASMGIDALRAASDFRVIPNTTTAGAAVRVGAGAALTLEQLTASRMEAEAASRELARPVLPGCDGVVVDTGAANGRLSDADLCDLWEPGHQLRADAAVALAELNVAYQEAFGEPLAITDSYRSYAAQVSVRRRKPGLAARPGTSEHGWGLAVDLAGGVQNADRHYRWLRENAPRFGWDNPAWARSGGSGPYEPWHWEFVGAQSSSQG